ncbi:flavodoxin domain-containing protein [Clostridium sp. UBA4548]|uniref:flavodoxin domain-containing protein n=1 Tax=Clostridium sp. UBA4548 TaxID=1946361 RepID=UPI0025C1CAE3|nr:flavodoxin domain-containing protein [Clostridium sp. UBA4548]
MLEGNNKVLVIYKSKYGSTKRYATWIAEEVKGDLVESAKVKIEDLGKYHTIVFGGFLYAGSIKGIKIITDNFQSIKDKNVIVFAVGSSSEKSKEVEKVFATNLNGELRDEVKHFYLRGALNYKNMGFIDKVMMGMLRIMLKKALKGEVSADERAEMDEILKAYDNPVDWTDKKAIEPMLQCINKNLSKH